MNELFEKLKITPNDLKLYNLAFSHSSYVNEKHLKADYERLEFLGDAVLDLVMSDYLYNHFPLHEGDMTKIRANYVCENACFTYASNLGFSKYIKVGHGEEKEGGRFKKVILADIFESFMGAIYLDLGYQEVRRVILEVITPYIEDKTTVFFNDYKSSLQELVQTDQRNLHYDLIEEKGPAHLKEFTMAVKIDGIIYGTGVAGSKKEAEQEAAKSALEKLATLDLKK